MSKFVFGVPVRPASHFPYKMILVVALKSVPSAVLSPHVHGICESAWLAGALLLVSPVFKVEMKDVCRYRSLSERIELVLLATWIE
jgi:hypothetical protein